MTTSLWTRTVALGIVAIASIIGNVSMSASEFSTQAVPSASGRPGAPGKSVADAPRLLPVTPQAPASMNKASATVARPAATTSADVSDEGEVVPAIFARDPDVRFMFYRHLSKWM